ncbi:VOC family protein [Streptomyces exfoliatus]|uniref:VOC family protein n=1 Tax=Streptomyces exfoliatus TaxID=1905 RepID=A0ABV3CYX1_STREX
MNWTLEVVPVPVTDMDRAKEFYGDKCGFKIDLDDEVAPGMRIIQATPPGSRCSIAMLSGMPSMPGTRDMAPGSLQGLQLCVTDIEAARAELVDRGVDVTPIRHVGAAGWEDGRGETWNSFMAFEDPDGNGWVVQEAPSELSER